MKHYRRRWQLLCALSAVAGLAGFQTNAGSMMRTDGDPRAKVMMRMDGDPRTKEPFAVAGPAPVRFPPEPHSAMTSPRPSAMLIDLKAPLAEPGKGSARVKPAAFPREPKPSGSRK